MVERRRVDRGRGGRERDAEKGNEGEEGGSVKCEFGSASVVSVGRVWHSGELGAGKVVAVHGHKSCNWGLFSRVLGGVEFIKPLSYDCCQCCFALKELDSRS